MTRSTEILMSSLQKPELDKRELNRRELELPNRQSAQSATAESADYWRGYRDGQHDRIAKNSRKASADGILGALLAIVLLGGVGYVAYQYSIGSFSIPQIQIKTGHSAN
ncbi:MAG: hypothetical protein KME16_19415 [Scytolyngbya sp. HA4215-MV1]|jgi:hypothetical protein|nr:hypothetical protein [Scytolyngbya sp. HA4215-MV1]